MKLKGLVPLVFSFLIGCSSSGMLKGGIYVDYFDEDYNFVYLPIRDTKYYIEGKGGDGLFAENDATERLSVINTFIKPSLKELEEADRFGKIDMVIEYGEYEELVKINSINRASEYINNRGNE